MMTEHRLEAVARARGRTITRQEILCRYAVDEQAALDQILAHLLYQTAIEHASIVVTDDDVAREPAMRALSDENVAAAVENNRRWLRAALLVLDGKSLPSAASADEQRLQNLIEMFGSREAIAQAIDRIDAASVQKQMIDGIRFDIGRRRLQQYIVDRARTSGMPLDRFAETFWNEIIRETGVAVMDPQYRLLSWRELSWNPTFALS